ncbi:MAG: hypothetical protein IKP34_06525 [Bacteroidales bacterium]|nr:hypothetical protein [Bacteroidales bacterium]
MKKGLSFILLALCLVNIAKAQENRPGWLDNKPKAGNSTYVYVVERGGGRTVNEAVNNALLKVMRTTMMRIGAIVSWDEVNSAIQKGDDWGTVAMRYNIPINKVCEYVEQKTERGYRVAVLCQVAKSGAVYPEFDDFTACRDTKSYSNGSALLKSVFIPGWGQMSKRHYGSGIFTLLGEVVFIGGAAGTYFMAQNELATMREHDVTLGAYNAAKSNYDQWRMGNIACISAAGVLYVYNLIRAYTMTPKYKERSLSLSPAIIPTNDGLASGVNLTLNF